MLLRCCSVHIAIIVLKHILYLKYFCLCLSLGMFMSYLCDLLFIFSLIFTAINHITSSRQTHLFFVHFLEYLLLFLMITWMKKAKNSQIKKVQPQGVAKLLLIWLPVSAWRCLLVLLTKKACILQKRVFLKILQNSQQNACVGKSF